MENYHVCVPVFYLTMILVGKMWVKKIGRKILPKDGKRMRQVQIFGILAVRELPFRIRYHSFGSLMPVYFICYVDWLQSILSE